MPAFALSTTQRYSGGQKETQFGLTFNYHFGIDWEDQLSPSMVTKMRTVGGSRHDFVNQQNEMILEYRAKEGASSMNQLRALKSYTGYCPHDTESTSGGRFWSGLSMGDGDFVGSVDLSSGDAIEVGNGGVAGYDFVCLR